MKALSIKQPWAELIVSGVKDIENRSWQTNHRGRIYVHASQAYDSRHREMSHLFTREQWESLPPDVQDGMVSGIWIRSAIIGEVRIIGCIQNHESIWAEQSNIYDATAPMRERRVVWNWILADPVKYEQPIYGVRGALSLWEYNIAKHALEDGNENI